MERKSFLNFTYSPLSTIPSPTFQSDENGIEYSRNHEKRAPSTFSVIKQQVRCCCVGVRSGIHCDSKFRIGIAFILLFFTIYLLHYCFLGEYFVDVMGTSGNEGTVIIQIVDIKPERRPYEGYVLDTNRINKYCEPENYEKSTLKKFRVQDCLDYLDTQQHDYMVKPSIASTTTTTTNTSILTSNLQCAPGKEPMLFHVYWRGKVTDKPAINIKSFLYTQPLSCSKMVIWLDNNEENLSNNKYVEPLLQFSPTNIEFRKWNVTEQLNHDTIYSGWKRKLKSKIKVVGYSDMVRFVLLHRYGGMYVDADTIFLRDMSPLYYLDYDFSYRWSLWLNYNTAILRLRPNSTTTRKIISGAMKNKMKFHPYQIKKYLISDEKNITKEALDEQLYMMPVPIFDPLWLKSDLHIKSQKLRPNLYRWTDVYSARLLDNEFPGVDKELLEKSMNDTTLLRKKDEFFRGAFTYHWHNRWNRKIENGSWFDVLQKGYDDFIQGVARNPYNEWVPSYM